MAAVWLFLLSLEQGFAQGTLQWTVTFDGTPTIQRDTGILVSQYFEAGMWFKATQSPYRFEREGGGSVGFPENGTAYLLFGQGDSLAVSSTNPAQPFGVVSVDLAEFSVLYAYPIVVPFIGYKPDGSAVTIQFTTDGIIDGTGPLADFQTFYFDDRFRDLVRLDVADYGFALDNMVFAAIPEPTTSAFVLALGGILVGGRWLRKRATERCARPNRRAA